MHSIFVLFTLLAVATALPLFTPTPVHLVAGWGSVAPGSPYGTPTLSLAAFTDGATLDGNFFIYYPADADFSGNDTVVTGSVSCFSLSTDGSTAYVTLLVATSSGPRSATYPVGGYVSVTATSSSINWSAATYTTSCASPVGGLLPLTAGEYYLM